MSPFYEQNRDFLMCFPWPKILGTTVTLCLALFTSARADTEGPIADWNFDEGRGQVAQDRSGNSRHAEIHGASWVPQGDGFALHLDGLDDYVNLTASQNLDLSGPISIEAWIKPLSKSQGLASLFGESLSSYLIGYYAHAELVYWFIGGGGNKLYGKVNLREWNHIAGTFDGKQMNLWLNGHELGAKQSQFKSYKSNGTMAAGTKGRPDLPKFRGLIDGLRIYDRALAADEVVAHFTQEAPQYGFDPAWFQRLKVTPYYYFERDEIVVEANFKGLMQLQGRSRLDVTLARQNDLEKILHQETIDPVPPRDGIVEATLPSNQLTPGKYTVRVEFKDAHGSYPVESFSFSFPAASQSVPDPSDRVLPPLAKKELTPFRVGVEQNGGLLVRIDGKKYPFETKISWPQGDFNHLGGAGKSEPNWKVKVRKVSKQQSHRYTLLAQGDHYTLDRQIRVYPTHIYVHDTFTNTTKEDLGLLVYHDLKIPPQQVNQSRLGGFERGGRLENVFSPSVFVADDNTGIGFLPIDDVFVIQSVLYNGPDGWGMGTEKLALAPGTSYTMEWAIYPTGSGDYYDFINAFRTVEDRIATIDGGLGFFTNGPKDRDQIPTREFIEERGLRYGLIHNLAGIVDDPSLSVQGVEFVDFPKERQRLKNQVAAIHEQHPDFKVLVHIAHSLYCTDKPDRFSESQVISPSGEQAIWGVPHAYISKERQDAGWKFWSFYPTPGNKFHDVMISSVDVLIDEIGIDGTFMDGFFAGYGGRWTYDGRWDGYSAEINPTTKTISRKLGSVLLLSQPSLVEYCRKIFDKGGTVVANNTVVTRSIANEKHILHDSESGAGPQLHLAPTATALAIPTGVRTMKDVYQNVLENLRWGELFIYYGGQFDYPYRSLASRQFPMTFEEIRGGIVKGPERIVTMNSGVYGWHGDRRLHLVYGFDARGAPFEHNFVTTVDKVGVRSEMIFEEDQSAVIEPIPVELHASSPINLRVSHYTDQSLELDLHGQGKAQLTMLVGDSLSNAYHVSNSGETTTREASEGILTIPLQLAGKLRVSIKPAE